MTIVFFTTASGQIPVKRYLDNLERRSLAAMTIALQDLQTQGMSGATVVIRKLRVGLWELKVGPHRVVFTQLDHGHLVLLHAFRKQSQRTPSVELTTARSRLARLLRSTLASSASPPPRPKSPKPRR